MDYEKLKSTHKSPIGSRSIVEDFDPIYENKINQEKAIVLGFVNGSSVLANKRRGEVVPKSRRRVSVVENLKPTKPPQLCRQIEITNEKSPTAVQESRRPNNTPQQALTEKLHKKIPNSKNVVVCCTAKTKDNEQKQYAEKMITYEAVLVQQSKKSNTHQVNRKANRGTSRLQHCCGGRINYAFDFSSELHTTEKLCVC
ncbi:GMP synthase [Trichinella spiralis]|uniref:GMP synthase n=1 Tax=Trichinella spiralis TaxID=6334 RepID=A0ABR3KAF0_TRISP